MKEKLKYNEYPKIKISIPYTEYLEGYCEYHNYSVDGLTFENIKNAPIIAGEKIIGFITDYQIKDGILEADGVLRGVCSFEFMANENHITVDSYHLTL